MFIILTYDISSKRSPKVLKICRKYLTHVQKSVFEGNLTDRQLIALKQELQKLIVPDKDQIAIYELDKPEDANKEMIGYHLVESNIL